MDKNLKCFRAEWHKPKSTMISFTDYKDTLNLTNEIDELLTNVFWTGRILLLGLHLFKMQLHQFQLHTFVIRIILFSPSLVILKILSF